MNKSEEKTSGAPGFWAPVAVITMIDPRDEFFENFLATKGLDLREQYHASHAALKRRSRPRRSSTSGSSTGRRRFTGRLIRSKAAEAQASLSTFRGGLHLAGGASSMSAPASRY